MPLLFRLDPFLLTHEQVDKGAIRFILSGANIMCPGLTSPGAKMTPVEKDTVVVSFHVSADFSRFSLDAFNSFWCTNCNNIQTASFHLFH